jgi:glutathione S-transferase
MITVHHLNNSRSQRVLWLLEEIGAPYEIVAHKRDATTRLGPDSLKAVHPLGKSPVIVDGEGPLAGQPIIESGAILEYLTDRYGAHLKPAANTPAGLKYLQWMHFAEGSAMLPLLLKLYVSMLGENGAPLNWRIDSEIANHLGYMETEIAPTGWACDNRFTTADVQLAFVLEAAAARGPLKDYPGLSAYLAKLQDRDAYKRALDKGGPYALGR